MPYSLINQIQQQVYDPCGFSFTNFRIENEQKEYFACKFCINDSLVICRTAKITPKKVGQFVSCWKRDADTGQTKPFDADDTIDFYVINVQQEGRLGQFVFPASVLIDKRILSTSEQDGKRGFRVYPIWSHPNNKQAVHTQRWQLNYFFEIQKDVDVTSIKTLFGTRS